MNFVKVVIPLRGALNRVPLKGGLNKVPPCGVIVP
jgi:hypothetical protein